MNWGIDVGTYNIVVAHRVEDNKIEYKQEVNGFVELRTENPAMFNMMRTSELRPGQKVPLVELNDENVAYVLGEAAVAVAYAMPQVELKRSMQNGCLNPKEQEAQQILSLMINGLIDGVEPGATIFYSVPANAINEETDADYHAKVIGKILSQAEGENGPLGLKVFPLNEGLALVYAELAEKSWTGIGVSCLVPGTKIYTDKGIVNIEDVKIGDMVITHKGRFRRINNIITKEFNGSSTKLQLQGYVDNVELYQFVDNHELYVYKNGEWKWIGCEEVQEGDIVGEPIIKQDRECNNPTITLCERTTCSQKLIKKHIEVSADVQRLIGYFLGDGHVNRNENSICFDFGLRETQYVEDVKQILLKNFDKNSTETIKEENCIRLKCYSKGLVSWFNNHCYDENKNKKYPWDIKRINRSACISLLCGLIRSDGCVNECDISFYNTNTNLIVLAKHLFSRIGIAANLSYREPRSHYYKKENRMIVGRKKEWKVSSGTKMPTIIALQEIVENVNCDNSKFLDKTFIDGDFCCSRVQTIEHGQYEGTVYDLQVEEDHSFSGPFLTIHNCGAGMVNICYSIFGAPIFEFSLVNSGDWIDKMASKAIGEETTTYVNQEKLKTDLSIDSQELVQRAIKAQYEIMIQKTVAGIKRGLETADKKARTNAPVDIVVSGGTSSPNGFPELFETILRKSNLPLQLGRVIRPKDPLYSVSRGLLIAAENSQPIR
jgi:intein/homing endonuclease